MSFICAIGQGSAFITVNVELDEPLPQRQGLYIRGNQPLLGNWQHAKIVLARRSPTLWSGIFILAKDQEIKFVLDGGSPRKTFAGLDTIAFMAKRDTSLKISLSLTDFKVEPELPTGKIQKFPLTATDDIQDRMVRVRTPIGYDEDTSRQYPLVILHDGQSLFDADESPDKGEWRLDETLDSLEIAGVIDPFILVAVDHVFKTRSIEYADTDFGDRYQYYLTDRLIPMMRSHFRVSKSPSDTYIGGAIAGGFVSFLTSWRRSDVVANGLLFSPAMLIHENDFGKSLGADTLGREVNYFIDIGEFGLDEELRPGVDSLVNFLRKKEIPHLYNEVPNSIPDSENMSRRVIPAILYFFRKQ